MSTKQLKKGVQDLQKLKDMIGQASETHPVVVWSRKLWEKPEPSIDIVTGLHGANQFCYKSLQDIGLITSCADLDRLLADTTTENWPDIHLLVPVSPDMKISKTSNYLSDLDRAYQFIG